MNIVMPHLKLLYLCLLAANMLVLGLLPFRKYGLLLILISWALTTQLARDHFKPINEQYSQYCYRAYHFGEMLLMTAIYSQFSLTRQYRRVFQILAAIYFCFMVWFYTYIKSAGKIDFIDFSAGGIIISFYAALFLYKWYENNNSSVKINKQFVLFNISILFFYALNISIMALVGLISQRQPATADSLHNITRLMNLPLYTIFLLVFLRLLKQEEKLVVSYI